jgi:hypothetical protein
MAKGTYTMDPRRNSDSKPLLYTLFLFLFYILPHDMLVDDLLLLEP